MSVADQVVVMNEGRIEQAATPREIYNFPDTGFVARFIGGHNILTGTICASSKAEAGFAMTVPAGRVVGLQTVNVQACEAGSVALRSDKIRLHRAHQDGADNCVQGIVRTIEYHGAAVSMDLDVEGTDDFSVAIPEAAYFDAPVNIGDEVCAIWEADAVHLLNQVT